MNATDYLVLAGESLRGNKLRAILTLLGITIGIAAVIVLASVGAGTRRQVLDEFNAQAGNQVMIMPRFDQNGKPPLFPDPEDLAALRREVPAAAVVPLAYTRASLWHRGKQYYPQVSGTTRDYLKLQRLHLRTGRFLSDGDEEARARVCILGGATADKFFGVADPVGDYMRLNGERFRIVGVLARKETEESLFGMMGNERLEVYVPAATALAVAGVDEYMMIMVEPPDPKATAAVTATIKTVLAKLHGPQARYTILSTEQILKSLGAITAVLTALLVAVGSISLVVGGIGIMNIMLVSVTERTREIGVRKSVGAKRGDILRQFLAEAVFLCLCGGALGLAAGIAGARLVEAYTPVRPLLSWWIFALAIGFAAAVGILFGTYPAWKAARLDPIEALRYE